MSHKQAKQQRKENPEKKLRIIWDSNSVFTSSGYGTQSKLILNQMIKAGYKVAMQSSFGLLGGKIELDGMPIYPLIGSPWGEDGLIQHGKEFNAHVSFTFLDVFPLNMQLLSKVKNWIPYAPIDGEPLSEHIKARLNLATEVVTHSKFGHNLLIKNGFASTYIPLSVDTKVMKPISKKEARDRFGIPQDKFVFGMVAANKDNPSRKSFQEVIDAFSNVVKKNPNCVLYLHTNLIDQNNGFPIMEYCSYKGLQGKVFMLDPHTMQFKLDREAMAYLYSSFDCLLNPSSREGFGIPIIEAQSCGVPVVVNDCQSMPELVNYGKVCKTGWKQWSLATYLPHPDVEDLEKCMLEIMNEISSEKSVNARKFVQQNYDVEVVFKEKWLPYLERLEKRYAQ